MNYDEFFIKYNGKKIDFDGAYSAQCVDLFNRYLVDCLGISNPIQMFPVASAYQIWDYAKDNSFFKRVQNTPTGVPNKGDILIWNKSQSLPYGHVAIFDSGDVNKFKSFDQNWPLGSVSKLVDHNYTGLIGWLSPVNNQIQEVVVTPVQNPDKLQQAIWDFSFLDGQKTKIVTTSAVIVSILYSQGYIDSKLFETLSLIFTALVGVSLRDAIKKK